MGCASSFENNLKLNITFYTKRHKHTTHVLKYLHWLPVKFTIDFKILLILFKVLNGLAPENISTLYEPTRTLRSGGTDLLVEAKTRLAKMGDRAFSNYAPRLWNLLPLHINASPSVQTFKKNLKHIYSGRLILITFNSLNKLFLNFPYTKSFFSYDCSSLLNILIEIAL